MQAVAWIASQDRQENFSRTCWITNQLAGMRSSDLRDVFSELVQAPGATRACRQARVDLSDDAAGAQAAGVVPAYGGVKASTVVAGAAHLIVSPHRGERHLDVFESQLELADPGARLRGLARTPRAAPSPAEKRSQLQLEVEHDAVRVSLGDSGLGGKALLCVQRPWRRAQARIIAWAAARSFGKRLSGVSPARESRMAFGLGAAAGAVQQLVLCYPAARGRHVFCGARQSMPSSR